MRSEEEKEEVKKKEIECKGNDYIGFDFCEGGANMIEERGGFCKVEEGMSVPLLATWPAMEEREKEIFVVEVSGSVWKKMEFGILENWKRL